MNHDELRAQLARIQQEERNVLQQASDIIEGTGRLSKDSGRVAQVAHNSELIMREIEQDFASSTGITNPTDMAFMSVAIALQCLRWFALNKLTERQTAGTSDFEKWVKGRYQGSDIPLPTPYYADYAYIIGNPTVPYDATKAPGFVNNGGLRISGHRNRTLGHDPMLGFVFGTANILTSTLTNNHFQSYHVMPKGNVVIGNASTLTMFSRVAERVATEPKALGAAVIKQGLHIATDVYTKEGIPLPFIQLLDENLADTLGKFGLDTGGLLKAVGSAKLAALIDSLIATVHSLYWDESKCSLRQYEVRTKKILSVSKIIAEGSNVIATVATGNIMDLDIGGLGYTFFNLLKDIEFMTEVKKEYMSSSFNRVIMGTT